MEIILLIIGDKAAPGPGEQEASRHIAAQPEVSCSSQQVISILHIYLFVYLFLSFIHLSFCVQVRGPGRELQPGLLPQRWPQARGLQECRQGSLLIPGIDR